MTIYRFEKRHLIFSWLFLQEKRQNKFMEEIS
nr:MAG TPA: hypothetical protein [Caudoviricetes sp.]